MSPVPTTQKVKLVPLPGVDAVEKIKIAHFPYTYACYIFIYHMH